MAMHTTQCTCARIFIPPGAASTEIGGVLHRADGPCYYIGENERRTDLGQHHFVAQDSPQPVDQSDKEDPRSDWQKDQDMRAKLIGLGLLPNPNACSAAEWHQAAEPDPRIYSYQQLLDSYALEIMDLRRHDEEMRKQAVKYNRQADRSRALLEYLRNSVVDNDALLQEMFSYALQDE